MATYLAPAALGLGDLVVTLPVVQQLIARGKQVYLIVRAEEHVDLARRIPGLAGTRLEWEVPECLSDGDEFLNLRDHPLEKVAWWGSKPFIDAYPGWTIENILSTICGDKGLPVDFGAPYQRLKFARRPELSDKVLLVPGSAVSAKCWPLSGWLKLASELDCVVIGQPENCGEVRELLGAELPWYETPTVADALDAVSSAKAVVSVDTGIMHIAVHQGTPTVGLFRAFPVYVRAADHFRAITANKACEKICYEREVSCAHNARPSAGKDFRPNNWNCQVESGMRCMETIDAEDVLNALTDLCAHPNQRRGTGRLPALP